VAYCGLVSSLSVYMPTKTIYITLYTWKGCFSISHWSIIE